MTNFEKITETPETLAGFLSGLPVLEGPWDKAFQTICCAGCKAENCEDEVCLDPKGRFDPHRRVAWWLGLEAEG